MLTHHGRAELDPGSARARCDQRPAICRLRHDQRCQRLAVHEHARPADGAGARRQRAGGQRVALAQACDVEACDAASPLSAWFSGLGGLGSVQGDGNSSTLTYNLGGAAAGIDYRFDPRFLVGLGVGYTHGTQWVNSFMGQGWTDIVSASRPTAASLRRASMPTRWSATPISTTRCSGRSRSRACSNARPRAARAPTSSWRQVETGYKLGVCAPTAIASRRSRASRLRARHRTRSPSRARSSLNLNVAQQTTNSVRTVLGAEFGSSIPPWQPSARWASAFAWAGSTSTPTPAGRSRRRSPARRSASFTVYGATPTRDAAIVGFSASDQHRGSHAALPALRRRARLGHRQPRAHGRLAHELVTSAIQR